MYAKTDISQWQNLISMMVRTGALKINEKSLQKLSLFIQEYIKQIPQEMVNSGVGNQMINATMNILLRIAALDIINISVKPYSNYPGTVTSEDNFNIKIPHGSEIPMSEYMFISDNISQNIVKTLYSISQSAVDVNDIEDLYDVLFLDNADTKLESGQPFLITNAKTAKKLLKISPINIVNIISIIGRKSKNLHKAYNIGNLDIYVSDEILGDEGILGVKPDDETLGLQLVLPNEFIYMHLQHNPFEKDSEMHITNKYYLDTHEIRKIYKLIKFKF